VDAVYPSDKRHVELLPFAASTFHRRTAGGHHLRFGYRAAHALAATYLAVTATGAISS
jgi:hypothetical protein